MLIISDLFIVLCALYCQADEGLVLKHVRLSLPLSYRPCLRLWGSAGCCVVNWCVSWAWLNHSHNRRLSILMLTSLVKTSYSLLCTSSMYLLLFCIVPLYIWDDVSGCWRWARPVRSDRPNQDTAASSTSTLNNIQQVHHRNLVCDQQSCCDEL